MTDPNKESKVVETTIEDLPVAGDEIPEESLRLVSGGLAPEDTGGPCGGCH